MGEYRAVVDEQTAAYEETTAILKTVTDEASMAAAHDKLEDRARRFAAIAERARKLGRPSEEILEQLSGEYGKMKLAFVRYTAESQRVRRLPGGDAFIASLSVIEAKP